MLVYQSGEAAIQLFSGDSPEARKILGAALPALATQGDYKVGRVKHSVHMGSEALLTLINFSVLMEPINRKETTQVFLTYLVCFASDLMSCRKY